MTNARLYRLERTRCRALCVAIAQCSALLMLGGCESLATQGPQATAVAVPPSWSTAPAAGLALARWWTHFGDARLDALVDEAMQHNVDVLRARATFRQSLALRDQAAAALWPTLDATVEAQRGASGDEAMRTRQQAGLDARWAIDVFGSTRAALRASTALAEASAATLDDVRAVIVADVVVGYIAIRGAQAREAIARESAAIREDTLQIARWRAQAGLATALETEQATADLAQALAQRAQLAGEVAVRTHALAVLTGAPPAALGERLARVEAVPTLQGDIAAGIPAEVIARRADIVAAARRLDAAIAAVAQADAARLPGVQLNGSLGVSALSVGGLTDGDALTRALLASISVPMFDGGARRAVVRAREAERDGAIADLTSAVLLALQDVEDLLSSSQADALRLTRLREAAAAANVAAVLARQRYGAGLIDFLTVLDTQRTELATADAVASASTDLGIDHARLYAALGGGWPADEDGLAAQPGAAAGAP